MNAILGTLPREVNYSGACDCQNSISSLVMRGLLRQEEAVPLEDGGALGTLDVVQECTSRLLIFGGLQDHRALLKTRIGLHRNLPIHAACLHGGRGRQPQGDEADNAAPRLGKLPPPRDIIAPQPLALYPLLRPLLLHLGPR